MNGVFVSACLVAGVVLSACGGAGNTSPPTDTPTHEVTIPSSTPTPTPTSTSTSTATSTKSDGPLASNLCGCSLCRPVLSEDTCTTDADCAPSTPCHADRCVAKAHAQPKLPHLMCTQSMSCGSVDANACGCLMGRCALYPRKP